MRVPDEWKLQRHEIMAQMSTLHTRVFMGHGLQLSGVLRVEASLIDGGEGSSNIRVSLIK